MAGLDIGIKLHKDAASAIDVLEKKKLGFIILQIDDQFLESLTMLIINF